jgi:CRISPR type III-B/RAMP module-associated protein Cmr5
MKMQSKSQQFSDKVFKNIKDYISNSNDELLKKKYKSLCKRSGGLLRTVGLISFLTYLKAKSQRPSGAHHEVLLGHLQNELHHFQIIGSAQSEAMLGEIRTQSLPKYMHTTKETLKLLQWHKRIADIMIEGTVDDNEEYLLC